MTDGPLLIGPAAPPVPDSLPRDLIPLAEDALRVPLLSVLDKEKTPPSGDKHDWMNLADYCWPDPDSPDGLPYVSRDGYPNPEAALYDRRRFNLLLRTVLRLGAAWRLTGNAAYAARAAEHLCHWFIDPATAMNPHLRYAHHTPGLVPGREAGLIVFCMGLPSLLDLWCELRGGGFIDAGQDAAMRRWAASLLDWLLTAEMSLKHAQMANNHGTWHAVFIAHLMLIDGRRQDAAQTIADALDQRLATHVDADGRQPLETRRNLSVHYSLFNLKGLMTLARLGEAVHVDGWRADSADPAILRAARYLYPFATGDAAWPHEQIEPPIWWYLAPLCTVLNHVYGPSFDLARIRLTMPGQNLPPEPTAFIPGRELLFAPSHLQQLPLDSTASSA